MEIEEVETRGTNIGEPGHEEDAKEELIAVHDRGAERVEPFLDISNNNNDNNKAASTTSVNTSTATATAENNDRTQVGVGSVPVVSAVTKRDVVHPNDRLFRILQEHSVKRPLPSVHFWDPNYKMASGQHVGGESSAATTTNSGGSVGNVLTEGCYVCCGFFFCVAFCDMFSERR